MSLETTKASLQGFLADQDNKVIALSGHWGTGKSHLWGEISRNSTDQSIKNSLYVSLFGIGDMATLKLKLVQSAVPVAGGSNLATDMAKTAWREGTKVLRSLHPGFAALDELALLAVPAMLRNRFLVLDDIERKHEKLAVDEVMGFIDEFTQRFGSRILLILNDDQLVDRGAWDKLREKVIDQEILLDTSAEEAFAIAISLSPSAFRDQIKAAVITCEVTNIRVIRKIIRSVNRVLEGHAGLSAEVLQRVVPSTVLLSAIHYKGLRDGPDADFVLGFNSVLGSIRRANEREANGGAETTDADKRSARWTILMDKLAINSCDSYELLLADYLKSGSIEISAVSEILEQYIADADHLADRARISAFFERALWHTEVAEADLVAEARGLLGSAVRVDPSTVTALHDQICRLEGGEAVAAEIVAAWIAAFQAREPKVLYGDDIYPHAPWHPDITAAEAAVRAALDSQLSLQEVCSSIVGDRSWGRREEAVMKSATVDDYERLMRSLSGRPLKMFLLQNIDLYTNRTNYEAHFGSAMKNFAEASFRISEDAGAPRLSKIVKLVFEEAKLGSHLAPKVAPVATPA